MAWSAGAVLTAAQLNTYAPQTWSSYSPSWTAATSNPVIGNGLIVGEYIQFGKLVHFRIGIAMGSTTTYGTGQWRITLPVTPVSHLWAFAAELRDTGTASWPGRAVWSDSGYLEMFTPNTTAGTADRNVATGVPFSWGSSDVLTVNGSYQVP